MSLRLWLVVLNVVGGIAVLGSYAHGIATHENPGTALWGGIPTSMRPLYTVGMLAAAVGYFGFVSYLLFGVDPESVRVGSRFDYSLFLVLHALILIPSAVWMPLTFAYVAQPSVALWWAVRSVLFLVGSGAIAQVVALSVLRPNQPTWWWGISIAGAALFAAHTAILDALVWPAYFPK